MRVVRYLENPPTIEQLDELCRALGVEPTSVLRSKEQRFAELELSVDDDRPRSEWLRILSENPILIERPIVCVDGRCVVGRPPERVRELLRPLP